jgi:hypothetical protein
LRLTPKEARKLVFALIAELADKWAVAKEMLERTEE